jgi:hypothetical protein
MSRSDLWPTSTPFSGRLHRTPSSVIMVSKQRIGLRRSILPNQEEKGFGYQTHKYGIASKGNPTTHITAIDLRVSLQCFIPTFEYLDKDEFGSSVHSYLVRIDDFTIESTGGVIPTSDVKVTYDLCRELARSLWAK